MKEGRMDRISDVCNRISWVCLIEALGLIALWLLSLLVLFCCGWLDVRESALYQSIFLWFTIIVSGLVAVAALGAIIRWMIFFIQFFGRG